MDTGKKKDGLLVTDDEGNTYFLRPEILEATKVTETEFKPSSKLSQATVIGNISIDKELDKDLTDRLKQVATRTVMCPW